MSSKRATVTMDDGRVYQNVQIVGSDNASNGGLNLHLRYRENGIIKVGFENTEDIFSIVMVRPEGLVRDGQEGNLIPVPEPVEGNHTTAPDKILASDVDWAKRIVDASGSMME